MRAAPSTPKTKRRRVELSRIAREADHATALEGLRKRRQEAAEKKNGEVSKTQDGAEVTADSATRSETVTQEGVVGAESDEKNIGLPEATTTAEAGPAIDSSMMLIANFKRRPRQPSILRMVRDDEDEQSDGDDLDFTLGQDELGPEDQSTPLGGRRSATLREIEPSDSDDDEIEIGRDASRINGYRSTYDQMSASALQVHDDSSPKAAQLLPPWNPEPAAKEAHSDGVEPFPDYVDTPPQPASPESQRAATPDTVCDTLKGSSEEETEIELNSPVPNQANMSKKRKSDGMEDAGKGIKNKKALSTAALRGMLPRRRRPLRKTRRQLVDDEGLEVHSSGETDSDDEEVDDVQDEDYVHGNKRQRRGATDSRSRRGAANARSKRGDAKITLPNGGNSGALRPPRGVTSKINDRNAAKGQQPVKAAASRSPTRINGHHLSPSHSVLGSSDKENHFGPRRLPRGKAGKGQGKGPTNADQEKGRKRVLQSSRLAPQEGETSDDPDGDDTEPETTPTKRRRVDNSPAPQRELNTDAPPKNAATADELTKAVKKFKEVDEWELCYEDDTGPSVTPPAPAGAPGTPVTTADVAQQAESRKTPDAPWSAFSTNTATEYNPPPSPSPEGPRTLGGQQWRRQPAHAEKDERRNATVDSPPEIGHHAQTELASSSLDDQLSSTTGGAEGPRGRVTRASKNEARATDRALSDDPITATATKTTRGRVSKNTSARGKTQCGSKKSDAAGTARSSRTTTGSGTKTGANNRGKGRARGKGK